MGKNQAHKAMQRSRVGSGSADPNEVEDGMVDGSFHSPEWHAARLANLKTSHTVTWEEFKKKQKEDELKKGELEADKDKMMREYRAQLDAERAQKLAQGRNHSSSNKEGRDVKKPSSKKRKHSRRRYTDSSSSSSSSDSSCSDDEEDRKSRRKKSRSKRSKKEKKRRSRSKYSGSDDKETEGPVPLSRFFGKVKN